MPIYLIMLYAVICFMCQMRTKLRRGKNQVFSIQSQTKSLDERSVDYVFSLYRKKIRNVQFITCVIFIVLCSLYAVVKINLSLENTDIEILSCFLFILMLLVNNISCIKQSAWINAYKMFSEGFFKIAYDENSFATKIKIFGTNEEIIFNT